MRVVLYLAYTPCQQRDSAVTLRSTVARSRRIREHAVRHMFFRIHHFLYLPAAQTYHTVVFVRWRCFPLADIPDFLYSKLLMHVVDRCPLNTAAHVNAFHGLTYKCCVRCTVRSQIECSFALHVLVSHEFSPFLTCCLVFLLVLPVWRRIPHYCIYTVSRPWYSTIR